MGSYNPRGHGEVTVLMETGVDANASSVSESIDIGRSRNLVFNVVANSGSHSNHIVTLQCSIDEQGTWISTSNTITGAGLLSGISMDTKFVRLKVTTNEGGASTIDWNINAK